MPRKKWSEKWLMKNGFAISERVDETGSIMAIKSAKQCPSKSIMDRRCRGLKNHKGEHWHYSDSGCLERWPQKKQKQRHAIAHESTPPGHPRYLSPLSMAKNDYRRFTNVIRIERKQFVRDLPRRKK